MRTTFLVVLWSPLGYFSGSVPYAKFVAARYGINIQKVGSGNIGFANVWREVGAVPALLVLVFDATKGALPVLGARLSGCNLHAQLVVGSLAILGHIFPVWLRFKGGKGVATGLGVSLVLAPWLALAGLAVYLAVWMFARRSAIASLSGAWTMLPLSLVLAPGLTAYYAALALLATWTHRSNIKKMLAAA